MTAVPPIVRSEGLAERLGDIALSCTGRPGAVVRGNLTLALNTAVTNLVSGGRLDVALTADVGGGLTLLARPERPAPDRIVFAGLVFTVPSDGRVELRITNLRGDATQGTIGLATIQATLAFSPPAVLTMSGNRVVVGAPQRGLYATTQPGSVANQLGSPLPDSPGFLSLLAAGSRFSSTRIREGFPSAFEPGTRIMLRFTGYPAGARLYSPDVIIGANGLQPTSAGDFDGTVSGGQYAPGGLALIRVAGANAGGSGGFPVAVLGTGTFDAVTEIPLENGSGVAVYEIADANRASIETAQIPVFLGLPRSGEARTLTTGLEVFFGPISADAAPRFRPVTPGSDCTGPLDCFSLAPRLEAYPQHTSFVAVSGVNYQMRFIPIENIGGGVMAWSARIEYKSGSGWARVWPMSGLQGSVLRLDIIPIGLAVGEYEATLVIDAGPAGIARYPLTLAMKALPATAPAISSIGGAATFTGPVAPGSLATIQGSNLSGKDLAVTFAGKPARILYASGDQINVEIPADLTGSTAAVVVSANGMFSPARDTDIAVVAPGIFTGAILNQDGRLNTPENPAVSRSVVQIFATGLLPAQGSAHVEARLGTTMYSGSDLPYAGSAPGISGMQQVNFALPSGLGMTSLDLSLCSTPENGTRVCSPPIRLHVRLEP